MAKEGKYAKVMTGLPTLPVEDLGQQEQIDLLKKRYQTERTCRACGTVLENYDGDACPSCGSSDLNVTEVKHTAESLAKHYMVERMEYDRLKIILSDLNTRVEAWEQLIVEAFDNDEPGWGLYGGKPNMIKLANGMSVAVQYEPQGKVKDREAFRLWCVANGLERALHLHSGTMNSMAKDRLLAGAPQMDGVEMFTYPKIVFRKGGE